MLLLAPGGMVTRKSYTTKRDLTSSPPITPLPTVEVGLLNAMSRETLLRQYLDGLKSEYNYVLLDCSPPFGTLVITTSDYVLIPVQANYLAAEDMTELVGTGAVH